MNRITSVDRSYGWSGCRSSATHTATFSTTRCVSATGHRRNVVSYFNVFKKISTLQSLSRPLSFFLRPRDNQIRQGPELHRLAFRRPTPAYSRPGHFNQLVDVASNSGRRASNHRFGGIFPPKPVDGFVYHVHQRMPTSGPKSMRRFHMAVEPTHRLLLQAIDVVV